MTKVDLFTIFTIATSQAFPTEHGKTPQTYYIGVHDNSLFKKLDINTEKITIRRDVSQTSLESMMKPKLYMYMYMYHRSNIQGCLAYTNLMGSDSIVYIILTSGNVHTFELFSRALPERPRRLRIKKFQIPLSVILANSFELRENGHFMQFAQYEL